LHCQDMHRTSMRELRFLSSSIKLKEASSGLVNIRTSSQRSRPDNQIPVWERICGCRTAQRDGLPLTTAVLLSENATRALPSFSYLD
jgi:hypothetical protein